MTVKYLLTNGNRELRADGIFTWTLPALAAKLTTGKNMLVCPSAGVCSNLCYARSGTYNFSNVKAAHTRNLELIVNDPTGWKERMNEELKANDTREANQFESMIQAISSLRSISYSGLVLQKKTLMYFSTLIRRKLPWSSAINSQRTLSSSSQWAELKTI